METKLNERRIGITTAIDPRLYVPAVVRIGLIERDHHIARNSVSRRCHEQISSYMVCELESMSGRRGGTVGGRHGDYPTERPCVVLLS